VTTQSAENSVESALPLGRSRGRLQLSWSALVVGSVFCTAGALRIDPDALGDLGIVTVMAWQSWVGLGLLVIGFSVSLTGTVHRTILPWLFLLALMAALHLAPAYAYGTLRYSWAWKHIGIVDYIVRNGSLDRSAAYLPAYHNWPGFFIACAWIAERFSAGPLDIAKVAAYSPPVFAALYLLVLHALFLKITRDRRLVFLAQFVFLGGNWIGQDYFSPQAATYLLYLIAMLLCLGPLQKPAPVPGDRGGWLMVTLPAFFARGLPSVPVRAGTVTTLTATIVLLVIIGIIAASHQLTPLILASSLTGLALIRRVDPGFAVFAFVFIVAWNLYFAAPFVSRSIADELATFGDAFINATEKLADLREISRDQVVVSIVSRTLTASIMALGVIGFWRRLRTGHVDGPLLVMLGAPLPVFVMTSYGGEAIFRVYLFMLPPLAFLTAATVYPSRSRGGSLLCPLVVMVAGCLLVAGFLISNNGKDMQYRFRPTEVDAAAWLYSHAPEGTLLIEGARNYPSQFINYENITYVAIANESSQSHREILDNPAAVFDRWLSDPKWKAGFVILTRSQRAYVETQGVMPQGSLDHLAKSLSASPRFKIVYRNADAIIFALNKWAPAGSDIMAVEDDRRPDEGAP
jgi:hypothetical protein